MLTLSSNTLECTILNTPSGKTNPSWQIIRLVHIIGKKTKPTIDFGLYVNSVDKTENKYIEVIPAGGKVLPQQPLQVLLPPPLLLQVWLF